MNDSLRLMWLLYLARTGGSIWLQGVRESDWGLDPSEQGRCSTEFDRDPKWSGGLEGRIRYHVVQFDCRESRAARSL